MHRIVAEDLDSNTKRKDPTTSTFAKKWYLPSTRNYLFMLY